MNTKTDEIVLIYNQTKKIFVPRELIKETETTITVVWINRPKILKKENLHYYIIQKPKDMSMSDIFDVANEYRDREDSKQAILESFSVIEDCVKI